MFMGWNFSHAKTFFQCPHGHFLLDGGDIFLQAQLFHDIGFDGAKTVLAFAEPDLEPPVDHRRDEGAAGQAEKFVKAAMQLA